MAISQQLRERIEAVAAELRHEVHGPRGCPPWGTKFVDMEQETTEIGDAIACAMLSQELQEQAEAEGHPAGNCGGCGKPIPFDEVAGRLLQARRGEITWQESYGRCRRCRKAFFPSLPSLGNRAG
jgi:hypothetical protein